jgi:hypothetical protein
MTVFIGPVIIGTISVGSKRAGSSAGGMVHAVSRITSSRINRALLNFMP